MSTMSESSEGVPWLDDEDAHTGAVATATVIEGAEVVRTAAVSYATPILHQVFIQGAAPTHRHGNDAEIGVVAVSPSSCSEIRNSPLRFSVAQATAAATRPHQNGLLAKTHCDTGGGTPSQNESIISTPSPLTSALPCSSLSPPTGSSPASSSVPLWVFSSSLLSSNSVVLRPVTQLSSSSSSTSPSPPSASSPPILSLPLCSVGGGKNDDELTSLSWLQDSNLLLGTALSPIKQQSSQLNQEAIATAAPVAPSTGERKRSHRTSTHTGRKETTATLVSKLAEGGKDALSKKAPDNVKAVPEEEFKAESPTSDYAEETSDVSGDGPEDGKGSGHTKATTQPQPIPYNPKIHVKAKPPFSFSCLIFMAIEESPTKALPVKDIYSWILEHYPYYRNAPTGWKNSVRHNLSLNKCFSKVEKAPNLGKGSLWMVDPTFRPNLLQAMSKTSLTPPGGPGLDTKNCVVSNKAIINTKYLYGLTSRTPEKVISMGDFVVQNEVEVRPSNTATAPVSCQQVVHHPESQELHDTQRVTSQIIHTKNPAFQHLETSNSATSFTRGLNEPSGVVEVEVEKRGVGGELRRKTKINNHSSFTPTTTTSSFSSNTTLYTPNPELFPRLARRLLLESSSMMKEDEDQESPLHQRLEQSPIGVQSEDVDAAAAMLVLKHGPRVLSPYHEGFPNLQASPDLTHGIVVNSSNKRDHSSSESSSDSGLMVISSSPSLDHAYVSRGNRKGAQSTHHHSNGISHNGSLTPAMVTGQTGGRTKDTTSTSPTSSVDEAFFDDSFENEIVSDSNAMSIEPRHFEEADALLNLAAVATSLRSRQMLVMEEEVMDPASCCTESQPSPLETQLKTQSRMNDSSNKVPPRRHSNRSSNSSSSSKGNRKSEVAAEANQLLQKRESGLGTNLKSSKRKATFAATKLPPSKKPANFTAVFPPKSNPAPMRPSHNNNSSAVLNRNKLLKVKKVLRAHKARC